MNLQVKYHYCTMCTLQDMDLNLNFNQGVRDVWTDKGNTICLVHFVMGHKKCPENIAGTYTALYTALCIRGRL